MLIIPKSNITLSAQTSLLTQTVCDDLSNARVRIHTSSRCPTTAAYEREARGLDPRCAYRNRHLEVGKPPPLNKRSGGAERDRTDDLMLAKHALSQLSYSPEFCSGVTARPGLHQLSAVAHMPRRSTERMVGPGRFELPTSRLSSARSNQLSYEPRTLAPGSHGPCEPMLNGEPPNHVFRLEEIRRRRCNSQLPYVRPFVRKDK